MSSVTIVLLPYATCTFMGREPLESCNMQLIGLQISVVIQIIVFYIDPTICRHDGWRHAQIVLNLFSRTATIRTDHSELLMYLIIMCLWIQMTDSSPHKNANFGVHVAGEEEPRRASLPRVYVGQWQWTFKTGMIHHKCVVEYRSETNASNLRNRVLKKYQKNTVCQISGKMYM